MKHSRQAPQQIPPEIPRRCRACGQPTDVCYTDGGALGWAHGDCRCRSCYVADGHPECAHCKKLLHKEWPFCPWCGKPTL